MMVEKRRFVRRKPGETTTPRERTFQAAVTYWAPAWTRVLFDDLRRPGLKRGSCYREGYATVTPLVRHNGTLAYHWRVEYSEGVESSYDMAKARCDIELTHKRVALHDVVRGCLIETDDGPSVSYEEVR